MECPRCKRAMTTSPGSPVSPYLSTNRCESCDLVALGCGDSRCDGYLVPEETGRIGVVRYTCVTCSWTGTGPRMPARLRVLAER